MLEEKSKFYKGLMSLEDKIYNILNENKSIKSIGNRVIVSEDIFLLVLKYNLTSMYLKTENEIFKKRFEEYKQVIDDFRKTKTIPELKEIPVSVWFEDLEFCLYNHKIKENSNQYHKIGLYQKSKILTVTIKSTLSLTA